MRITWRTEKARRNRHKHGLDFELAKFVFADRLSVTYFDRVVDGEERWHTIGAVGIGTGFKIVLVVHCYPEPEDETHVQIISLRRASSSERRRFEDGNR